MTGEGKQVKGFENVLKLLRHDFCCFKAGTVGGGRVIFARRYGDENKVSTMSWKNNSAEICFFEVL